MNKKLTQKQRKLRKIAFIVAGIMAILTVGYLITSAASNATDKARFSRLDTQIGNLFYELSGTSNEDGWQYDTSCTEKLAGDWPTGEYVCTASISLEKSASTVGDITNLQAKYYPIIDNYSDLSPLTGLDPHPAADFGKKFVVSSAEKQYTEKSSGIECRYIVALEQSSESPSNFTYGSSIDGKKGVISLSLTCANPAQEAWYPKS